MTGTSAKRQVRGAVNLPLLHPSALRLPTNPEAAQVVAWVCLLYFAFGIYLPQVTDQP